MTMNSLQPAIDPTRSDRPPAITASALTKRFGRRIAVDNASFTVPAGSVTGLVGPNGAGKTTLLAMLLGLVRPTAGDATVLGASVDDPASYAAEVGALIETPAFHPAVSARTNLRSLAALTPHAAVTGSDIDELLNLVGLHDRGDDRVGSYSLGMKQRLGIAAALLGSPSVVLLDEPTNGLDPVGMQEVREIIAAVAARGCTVLVSSHLLSELEQVCDWLVVLRRGGLLYQGSLADLTVGDAVLQIAPADPADLGRLAAVAADLGKPVTNRHGALDISLDGDDGDAGEFAAEMSRAAYRSGIVLRELHLERPDLHRRYLDLVGDPA